MPEDGELRTGVLAEYHDFGTPVDVQAPPPEETMDGSKPRGSLVLQILLTARDALT